MGAICLMDKDNLPKGSEAESEQQGSNQPRQLQRQVNVIPEFREVEHNSHVPQLMLQAKLNCAGAVFENHGALCVGGPVSWGSQVGQSHVILQKNLHLMAQKRSRTG